MYAYAKLMHSSVFVHTYNCRQNAGQYFTQVIPVACKPTAEQENHQWRFWKAVVSPITLEKATNQFSNNLKSFLLQRWGLSVKNMTDSCKLSQGCTSLHIHGGNWQCNDQSNCKKPRSYTSTTLQVSLSMVNVQI